MSPKQQARRALVVLLKSKLNSLFDELVWVLFLGHKDPWLSEVKFELSAAPGSDPCSKTIWKLHADYGRVPPDLLIGQSEDPVGKRCQKRVKLDYETSGVRQTPADRHPCCTAQQRTPVRCTCAKHRRPPSPTRGYGTSAIACGDLRTQECGKVSQLLSSRHEIEISDIPSELIYFSNQENVDVHAGSRQKPPRCSLLAAECQVLLVNSLIKMPVLELPCPSIGWPSISMSTKRHWEEPASVCCHAAQCRLALPNKRGSRTYRHICR